MDFDQVIYADRHELENRLRTGKKYSLLYAARSLFFTKLRFPGKRKADFLFFRSLVRDDYKILFGAISGTVDESSKIIVEDYLKCSRGMSLLAIVLFIAKFKECFKFKANGTYERLYLYMRLCFYFRVLQATKMYEFKHLVLFADMQPVENLLSQYYNNANKTTVTLQHGMYVEYENYSTVNSINYKHQPSQYFLSWGDETKQLILKYHPTRTVFVCGKPVIHGLHAEKTRRCDSKKYFTIILDQNIFEEQNMQLLNVCNAFSHERNVLINVRFHPYNHRPKYRYKTKHMKFSEDLDLFSSEFVVGHTSSLLYELLAIGVPTYKFVTDIPCVSFPVDLSFSTEFELKKIVDRTYDFHEIGKYYISCNSDESLFKYKKFFDFILENREGVEFNV